MGETPANNGTVKPRRGFRKFLFISLLVIVTGLLITYVICGLAYSEGTRSGILNKVSRKGYIFKTFEGEITIGGITHGEGIAMPITTFSFSVPERRIYQQLEALQGKKVVVHYRQVLHNFPWQGDSDYFVTEVNDLN